MPSAYSSGVRGPPRSRTTTESVVREPSSLAISRPLHPPPTITTSTEGRVFITRPHWGEPCGQSPGLDSLVSGEMLHQNVCPHLRSCSYEAQESRSAASRACRCSHHASDRRTCLQWCFA